MSRAQLCSETSAVAVQFVPTLAKGHGPPCTLCFCDPGNCAPLFHWACKHHSCAGICFTHSSLAVLASSSELPAFLCFRCSPRSQKCRLLVTSSAAFCQNLSHWTGSGCASRPHEGCASCLPFPQPIDTWPAASRHPGQPRYPLHFAAAAIRA